MRVFCRYAGVFFAVLPGRIAAAGPDLGLHQAQTVYFFICVLMQAAGGFACRTFVHSLWTHSCDNYISNFAIIAAVLVGLGICESPYGHAIAGTTAVPHGDLLKAIPCAVVVFITDEVRKTLTRFLSNGSANMHRAPTQGFFYDYTCMDQRT